MPARAVAILVLCNVVWALNVVVSKIAVDQLGAPPLAYAFARSALVMVVLLPLLRPLPANLLRVMLVGLAISGGSFALLFMGLETASPSSAGVVSLSGAPMTVLFAILFLGERVRWRRGLGIALAFGGVLISVMSDSALEAGPGLVLVFASAAVGALGSVFVKRIELSSIRLQAWAAVASSFVLLPLSLTIESGQVAAFADQPLLLAGCVVFAGLVVSVGAHTAYFRILQANDANAVVPMTLLTPLFTIALGAWLTGDPVGYRLLLGGAIAIAGVAIILVRPSETFTKRFLVRNRL
ncbi:DMT family transporter [Pelagerythrobacter marinus]|uniref:DMT family transporter n=1 Tax=Pelagerythrobacter marinus TaxID=538382 RepID=UPI0020374273|nr:DMT family transporter [Pelagerythrobacter marinus]USA40117.1 DMT family transporter [Pelagerythrobacter marinus]WPZ05760.1 DMT family transporter [Pelagerythrobacter marinus]